MADEATMRDHHARSHYVAGELLSIGAVALSPDNPFTWASGLSAPIYCDNRLTLAYPRLREAIAEGFAGIVTREALEPDVVAGTATAGIPHAAWLAARLDLPMAYVRSKPKAHGKGNQIEGRIEAGDRVVVVEDLVSTGQSSMAVVEAVRAVGAEVVALLAIFSYGLPHSEALFREGRVPFHTLTTFETLLDVAAERAVLDEDAIRSLKEWQRDPQGWSDRLLSRDESVTRA